MNRLQTLYKSTVGKKVIAAVTGLILFGFIAGHVAGNMKVFTGSSSDGVPHIDEYGHFLRHAGEPLVPENFVLWGTRLVLLTSVVLHILVVVQLAMLSQEARPVNYVKTKKKAASLSALYMMFSGGFLLLFIVVHLLHLTAGVLPFGEFEHGAIYKNLHTAFAGGALSPLLALFYVAAMVSLGFHLNHGIWSLCQTLGLDNPDRNKMLRMAATGVTVVIVLGFIAVPLSFMFGALGAPVEYVPELLTGHK